MKDLDVPLKLALSVYKGEILWKLSLAIWTRICVGPAFGNSFLRTRQFETSFFSEYFSFLREFSKSNN